MKIFLFFLLKVHVAILNDGRRPPNGAGNTRRRQGSWRLLLSMLLKEDVAMKTNLDFTPLYRSSIGFDRMVDMLESASRVASFDNWPPCDIAKLMMISIASRWRSPVSRRTS
ncbi:hypothetical protein X766_30255 [Mesorhizobium sp. LSJC255A00]|nr:hypothetical protein X766_30255 [Mesorhizobium sp. LSJC255A00]ESX33807.1 hypothetical protein X764_29175 [Mesorhizobium sp. LSHC440A00]